MVLGQTFLLGLCRRAEFSQPTMGLEIWQCMRGLASILAVRSMPRAGGAHPNEIPKPSAEGPWEQEPGWSQPLGEHLIYPLVRINSQHDTAELWHRGACDWPCAPLHCLAVALLKHRSIRSGSHQLAWWPLRESTSQEAQLSGRATQLLLVLWWVVSSQPGSGAAGGHTGMLVAAQGPCVTTSCPPAMHPAAAAMPLGQSLWLPG